MGRVLLYALIAVVGCGRVGWAEEGRVEQRERTPRRFIRYDARWDQQEHDPGLGPLPDSDEDRRRMRLRDIETPRERAGTAAPPFSLDPSEAMQPLPRPEPERPERGRLWIRPTLESPELSERLGLAADDEDSASSGWGWLAAQVGQRQREREEWVEEERQLLEAEEDAERQAAPTAAPPNWGGLLLPAPTPLLMLVEGAVDENGARLTDREVEELALGAVEALEDARRDEAAWREWEEFANPGGTPQGTDMSGRGQANALGAAEAGRAASTEDAAWRSRLAEADGRDDFRPTADFSQRIYRPVDPVETSREGRNAASGGFDTAPQFDTEAQAGDTMRRQQSFNSGWAGAAGTEVAGPGWTSDFAPAGGTDTTGWSGGWGGGSGWDAATPPPAAPPSRIDHEPQIGRGFSQPAWSSPDRDWTRDR